MRLPRAIVALVRVRLTLVRLDLLLLWRRLVLAHWQAVNGMLVAALWVKAWLRRRR